MGFFKKIGKSIKKATKQISFKNLVKIGTPLLSMIPIAGGMAQSLVGGMSEAHELKKQQKAAEEAGNIEMANQYAMQVKQSAAITGGQLGNIGGSVFGQITKGAVTGIYDGIGDGVKQGGAQVGASFANSTLNAWFKKHWWKVGAGLAVLGGVIFFATRGRKPATRRR